jgi:hypothetical protein
MTQEQNQEQSQEIPDEVMGFIANPQNRQLLLKQLASKNPNEYLALVKVNGQAVPSNVLNGKFIASDKEWQE